MTFPNQSRHRHGFRPWRPTAANEHRLTDRHGYLRRPKGGGDPLLPQTSDGGMRCFHADHRPLRGEGYGEAHQTAA